MRKISQEELQQILDNHKKWLNGEPDGERANPRGANLTGMDLTEVDRSE